jgi:tRNA pseudouridine55 synthase
VGRKRRGDAVDGVLLLDKPSGITSNLALQKARRALNAAKAGHAGTLDPLATGLLPLLLGEATKFSSDLLDADKGYRAGIRLGVRTDTADADGAVIAQAPVDVSREQVVAALSRFAGTILQVPPMHSALKRDGKPLYAYARAGVELERVPREVTIARIDLLNFTGQELTVDIDCSKGTYVRTLADDLGQVLGCGAHLAQLQRTRVGGMTLECSVKLATLEAMPPEARRKALLPVDALLQDMARIDLGAPQAARFAHGNELDLGINDACRPGRKRVYGPEANLLGIAELNPLGVLQPRRLLTQEARS